MFDILLFLFLGVIAGLAMGLVPGIHPNMIILIVPLLSVLNLSPVSLLAFIVAMGVVNSIVDFIPSLLLGAPDAGTELSVLPGHKMLLSGQGYEAVKLAVTGAVGSIIVIVLLMPFLFFFIPAFYSFFQPVIFLLLFLITATMILTEKGKKKLLGLMAFLVSGYVGLTMNLLPVDNSLILFPVFSGFFGVSVLVLQMRTKSRIPKQNNTEIRTSQKTINRSVLFGSIGGIFSGILPGVGSSEIATLATVDKNNRSFLITLGALTTANAILSILSLWLIGKARSGLAVAIEQVTSVGFNEMIIIVSVAVFSVGVASFLTLKLAKRFLKVVERIDYSFVSFLVVILIVFMTIVFTGPLGVIVLLTCTAIGLLVNTANVKRGCLMGVLILPTMLFYLGI